jgi:hypothetical protein
MSRFQKIGIWGCLLLGLGLIAGNYVLYGTQDLMRFAGGTGLLLFAFTFWLLHRNTVMMRNLAKRDED